MDCITPSNSWFLANTTRAAFARSPLVCGSRHPVTKTLSCFSLIFLSGIHVSHIPVSFWNWASSSVFSPHLISGGAPAGINILPGEDGCRTMRTSINIITRRGNKSTAPSGIDIFELPFKRIRLLKKANLGKIRSFRRLISSKDGRLGDEGIRFAKF